MSQLDLKYPAISDLRAKARRRMPKFAFEYVDSGTGTEAGVRSNRAGLDAVRFMPAILRGEVEPDLSCTLLGRDYAQPFGIAPVGMAGLIWPGAEATMAEGAKRNGLIYGQSTVAAARPEETGPIVGDLGWYQHYPVNDPAIRKDMLGRIKAAGWGALVVTVDVPGESRRERQRRANISMPPVITPGMVADMVMHPEWSLGHAKRGMPRMRFVEDYTAALNEDGFTHAGKIIRGSPGWDYIEGCRVEWDGPLIVKGVAEAEDADRLLGMGVDAIWVSNHSGRQFEGGPAAIDTLPPVVEAVAGRAPVLFCSGISGGLDILRAIALGADHVFLGKAWYFALGALGGKGIDHLAYVLRADMTSCMTQIGAGSLAEVKGRLMER
ncbi:alpha-hydroxy acid oxidase [Jannaschia sp. Os4]|uniref:alpha-hydroxy acid oxidase n=1 Tax=Jannaschia sp. Os4 TaxID=2807617 RepID=UPI0031B62C80